MAAEFATSIGTTIFNHTLGAIVRHVGYLCNLKKNMTNLKAQVKKLDDIRDDNSHAVLVAQRNAERIRSQVESWQNVAEKISSDAGKIMELYEENAKKRCLIGFCPNVVSHYQLSRQACKKQTEIVEAVTEANQFNGVADRALQQAMSTVSIEGYLTFDSRKSTLEEIMQTLKDATKNSIGVYGLGGMGKTTLVKQVASRAAEEKLFDEIVIAPVTQTPDLKEIQGQIANKLGLKLEESTVAERAGRIRQRLMKSKVLVILDDLWEKLDLEEVGIPFGVEHLGCKILLTSRFQSVFSSLGTKKDFHLGALKEEESWRLFEEKTTDVVKDLAFLDIGKKVAKRCAGLPVLIVTVAASLSSRPSLSAWKDALIQLTKMNNKEVHEIVNSAMEYISYNHLEETHKRLFLLCGLLGRSSHITDLLKYSWGWNLFDEDVVTMEEAKNKLHALILDLKASCLLLDGGNKDIIEIHDVVRGVAISLARKDQNMFSGVDDDTGLIRWPNDVALRSCTAMVFKGYRDLPCLPEQLECPSLEFFLLYGFSQDTSRTIPDTFFERTRELKVLDMTRLHFSRLPSSLSCLENLQTLCLDLCPNLEDISIVGDLKKLQVLSLIGSGIKELPRGIGQLSELRLLDLSRCSKLEIIPSGLLAGLSQLEELYMRRSFNKWEAGEFRSRNNEGRNVSLAELKHLPKLCSIEIEVEEAKFLSQDFNFERLERFRIIAGGMWDEEIVKKGVSKKLVTTCTNHLLKRSIIISGGMWAEGFDQEGISRKLVTTGTNHLQNGFKGLLKRAESLCLQELKGIKSVIDELDGDGFPDLKHLSIQTDYEIQFIINVELKQQRAFAKLESLHLSNLLKLEKICNSQLMQDSLCKLTTVNVLNCNKLESLFSFSMAAGLPRLQELQVSDCNILKGIVAKKSREEANGNTNEKIEIVQLRKLSLECLPQIISFYSCAKILPIRTERQNVLETDAHSEEIIQEEEETSSSMPFFKEVSFPKMEELKLSEISNLTEIWDGKLSEKSYCNLKSLVVQKCSRLVSVFSSNLLELSRKLEVLNVNCCDLLEEVFVAPGQLDIGEEHNGLVSQLIQLRLVDLPKLGCIWRKYHPGILSFKNLQDLRVEKCSSLKYLFTPSITIGLVRLQTLTVKNCVMMKEIVVKGDEETTDAIIFPQLSSLHLEDLPNLTTFYSKGEEIGTNENIHTSIQPLLNEKVNFPSLEKLSAYNCGSLKFLFSPSITLGLVRLKKLTVESCVMMEEIVRKKDGEATTDVIIFPQLSHLRFTNLPNLTIFYSGVEEMGSNENTRNDIQHLFNEKAHFPSLKNLAIVRLDNIKSIWHSQTNEEDSFCKLEYLQVIDCAKLLWIFPSTMLRKIQSMKQVQIYSCGALEEVFEVQKELNLKEMANNITTVSQLRVFHLYNLPKLRFVWKKDFHKILSFEYLYEVSVCECRSLKHVFPVSVAHSVQLEKLCVEDCKEVETIVDAYVDDENKEVIEEEVSTTFIFPKLAELNLTNLPKVECFYPRKHALQCPVLKNLCVNDCGKISVVHFLNSPENQFKKLFTKLDRVTISSKDMKMMTRQYGHFLSELFPNLKWLSITEFHGDESAAFPSKFLCGHHNLETLQVENSSFQEIFSYEGEETSLLLLLLPPHLTTLRLIKLPKLRYICREDMTLIPTLEKLSKLYVFECHRLTSLAPIGSVSFKFLTELSVQNCDGLINLIRPSAAVSLEQLLYLRINGCRMIEEIVTADGDRDSQADEIIFRKLRLLELTNLPSLTNFCTANYTFKFPELREVMVNWCSNMKTFSPGITITPMLKTVSFLNAKLWKGDLSTTIQQHFSEMLLSGRLNSMVIRSTDMKIMTMQHCHLNVRELTVIKFYDDESVDFLSKFLRILHNLETLEVKNCSFQEIFPYDGEGPPILLPHLTTLRLYKLPELKYICKENSPLIPVLEKLNYLVLLECPRLSSLVPDSVSFKSLIHLIVEDCGGLINLMSSSTIAGLEQLERLKITGCQMIEEIVTADGDHDSEEDETIIFRELRFLELGELPRLTNFCTTNYTFKFPLLKEVTVTECPNMRTFSPGITVTPMLEKVSFEDADLWKDDLNTTIQHFSEMETKRLDTTDPSTSSNSHFEPEAKQTESSKPREEGQASENSIDDQLAKNESAIEPREEIGVFATKPGKGKEKIEICEEEVVDSAGNEVVVWSHPYSLTHASSSFTSNMPFYQLGESSVPTGQQSEMSEETISLHSDPSFLIPANNEPEEQTNARLLAPRDVVASSFSTLSPASNRPETSPSLVTEEAGTGGGATSNSQQNDFQTLSVVRKAFVTLLSEFLQIYQTQPLNSMSADQGRLMVDAFRDMSNMNFSIEWFSPYVEKVKERLEQKREISEIELKIAETEAQLQALKEKKKALEDKIIS